MRAKRRRVRTHARVELIKGPAQLRECILGRLADLIRGSLAVLSGLRQRLAGGVEGVESSLRRARDILQALHQLFIGGVALVERIDCALDCLFIRAVERAGIQQRVQPTNDLIRLLDDVLRRSRRGIRTGNCALQIASHRADRGVGVTGALYQGGTALQVGVVEIRGEIQDLVVELTSNRLHLRQRILGIVEGRIHAAKSLLNLRNRRLQIANLLLDNTDFIAAIGNRISNILESISGIETGRIEPTLQQAASFLDLLGDRLRDFLIKGSGDLAINAGRALRRDVRRDRVDFLVSAVFQLCWMPLPLDQIDHFLREIRRNGDFGIDLAAL